jgi:outer membrane lipoprotein SlyB
MRTLLAAACAVGLLASVNSAQAIGCLSGAVAGGVAGHYAGHHAVLGAMAGCAAGHHAHKVMERRRLEQQNQAQPSNAAPANDPAAPAHTY